MNSTLLRMATVFGMLGFGGNDIVKSKESFSKPKKNKVRIGSLNSRMKIYREREQGTMSRRIARAVAKAIRQDDKREEREHGRKTDKKRHTRFA